MSGLLLDTSAIIGCFERRNAELASLIASTTSQVSVSVLSLGELNAGIRGAHDVARINSLRAAEIMRCVNVDTEFGPPIFGYITTRLPRQIGRIDCWIAASAALGRYELVTQDHGLAAALQNLDWSDTTWKAPTVTYVPVAG